MDMFFIEPESSSSVVEDSPSAHSLSPSPTNESSYQDIYDDPRPTVPRPYNYALSPSETPVNTYPDMSVRAYVGTRLSTTALAQGPDGSRVVVAGKDTLRILRVEDPEASQPSGYMNYSPSLSHADGTNSPGLRHSRTYAAAAASDADGGLTTSRFSQKSRRAAKSLSRYSGPNESAVFEDINLWAGAGTKLGFQSSIVDVEWSHGTFSNVIITAFGAGELVSWDLNKSSASKIDRSVRDAHIRSINCIRVSPTIGSALLTASQDGYVKYWDLRTFKPAVQISHPGTAVRALAFSPGFENAQALVGLETGVLLRYDLRTSRSAMDRLPVAHNAAILSIDWQTISGGNAPGWAATGGMDKTAKIWDMSAAQISSQPIHTLHATHAVKQVAWRPGNETELAIVHHTPGISHHQKGNMLGGTTSLAGIDMSLQIHAHGAKTPMLSSSPASHFGSRTPHPRQRALSHSESIIASASAENLTHLGTAQPQVAAYDGDPDRIEIWDVRRNWVAKYVLGDTVADGPVTELIWPASNARTAPPGSALWVAYSSGTFAQHDIRGVYRPLDSIPRSGITWETRGVVAFAVDAIERGEIPFDDVRPAVRTLFLNKGGRDKSVNDPPYAPRTQVKGSVPIPTFELGVFVKLARGYILGGASREDICLHNAQVALEAGQYRASQAWHMLLSLLTPLVVEGPVEQYADAANEYSSIRSLGAHLPGTLTPSPHSNQGSRAPSSGPAHGSLQRSSDSPRQKYPPGRSRRPTIGRRASRGSGSGSGHSRVNARSRSVSISSNSSLKHVGGGALEDESESSDGDISESEPESMTAPKPPAQAGSGLSQGRPYPSPLSRRVRNIDLAASARLAVPNEADEHNLSLMGGGSSDEHLPTDSEPLHNSPTSDLAPSELESDSDAEVGPSTTSLATLKPEPIGSRYGLLQRQDSRSSIGTAKPSLHPDDPASFISSQHKKERSGDTAHSHRASPAASRNPSLNMQNKRIPSDSAAQGTRTKGAGHTMFPDRGRSRKPRYEVNEAEAKYRQMGWEAMRETIAYYSERGDLQMSATLATVGGTELGISAEAHGRLIDAYLDMLSRLRLYAPAAYVRKYAKSKIAQKETMMGTTIYSACARCGKTLPTATQPNDKTRGQSGFCTKCKRFASKCSICRLPARGLYLSCIECSHGGHQECYRSYYLTRPLVNMDGSSTAANSRTNTILESDTKSASASVQSLGLGADSEKTFDDASSVKTDRTQDTLITDPSNRNSLELPIQETKGSLDWSPRGHPCAAGCGHYCWASNERGVVEVGQL